MKNKKYTITESGEVVQISPFGYDTINVEAKTKTEATKILLKRFKAIEDFGAPVVFSKNGELALVFHDGRRLTGCSCGNIDSETGRVYFVSYGGNSDTKTTKQALEACSFEYYCSEEYLNEKQLLK